MFVSLILDISRCNFISDMTNLYELLNENTAINVKSPTHFSAPLEPDKAAKKKQEYQSAEQTPLGYKCYTGVIRDEINLRAKNVILSPGNPALVKRSRVCSLGMYCVHDKSVDPRLIYKAS